MKTKKIIILVLFFASILLLYRFLSWGFLMSTIEFLNIIKIPSFIIVAISVAALLTDIGKAKKLFQLRLHTIVMNKKLQNYLLIVFSVCVSFLVFTNLYFTPPKWKNFINNEFLSGFQDDFSRANKTAQQLDFDKNLTDILNKCISIFKTRELINHNNSAPIDLSIIRRNINALNTTKIENNYIKAIMVRLG